MLGCGAIPANTLHCKSRVGKAGCDTTTITCAAKYGTITGGYSCFPCGANTEACTGLLAPTTCANGYYKASATASTCSDCFSTSMMASCKDNTERKAISC